MRFDMPCLPINEDTYIHSITYIVFMGAISKQLSIIGAYIITMKFNMC